MILLDHREQVAHRTSQAVEPHHDEGFTGGDVAQQVASAGWLRSAPQACSFMIVEEPRATQLIALGRGSLFLVETPA